MINFFFSSSDIKGNVFSNLKTFLKFSKFFKAAIFSRMFSEFFRASKLKFKHLFKTDFSVNLPLQLPPRLSSRYAIARQRGYELGVFSKRRKINKLSYLFLNSLLHAFAVAEYTKVTILLFRRWIKLVQIAKNILFRKIRDEHRIAKTANFLKNFESRFLTQNYILLRALPIS